MILLWCDRAVLTSILFLLLCVAYILREVLLSVHVLFFQGTGMGQVFFSQAASCVAAGYSPLHPVMSRCRHRNACAGTAARVFRRALMGEMIEFQGNGSKVPGYFAASTNKRAGVIVIQEWWGLVDHIKDVCDRFADSGINALAPDFYRGKNTAEPDEATKLMMEMDYPQALKDMSGAVDYLLAHDNVRGEKVGVMGFCMGGALALALAAERPDAVGACVPFYGVHMWGPDSKPDYSRIKAGVRGHYAELDTFFTPEAARGLETELKGYGLDAEVKVYEGCDHAFFNDTRPEVFNEDAASDAWQDTLDFFDESLR